MKVLKNSRVPLMVMLIAVAAVLLTLAFPTVSKPIKAQPAAPENSNAPAKEVKYSEDYLEEAVLLYLGSSVAYKGSVQALINPEQPEITPILENGKTLVPLRFIAESFDMQVAYEPVTKEICVKDSDTELKLFLGKNVMHKAVSGSIEYSNLQVAPKSINGTTYVPIADISTAFGKAVFYDRGLIIISSKPQIFDPIEDREYLDTLIDKLSELPTLQDEAQLRSLIEGAGYGGQMHFATDDILFETEQQSMSIERNAAPAAAADTSDGFSETNTQVEGVDEGDIIKTDGNYIYYSSGDKINIINVAANGDMRLDSTIDYTDDNFTPKEIYINDKSDKLIVIGSSFEHITYNENSYNYYNQYYNNIKTKAFIYDMTDKKDISREREIVIPGSMISSRMIGSQVYMVANAPVTFYGKEYTLPLPSYTDSAIGREVELAYGDIRYFPEIAGNNFMMIASFDLLKINEPAQISTYLGGGQNIYVSADSLYIASASYGYYTVRPAMNTASMAAILPQHSASTKIYKFSLSDGKAVYTATGTVPGTILNQFSMDEYDNHFRIATNVYSYSSGNESNNMYVLDNKLNVTGFVDNIAPGERIYSTRFMGSRAYMVTFKLTDPLFALDLSDHGSPKVLGALKIPGYSDYLHPYDENHLIGFGKDTIEYNGSAFYQGMKISMFDVSDIDNPKEMFTEVIGDRGTESPLLKNHKALLFSKDKNILAFPVAVYELDQKSDSNMLNLNQGAFKFQGAYVYSIEANGFKLKGGITHLTDEDYLKSGYGGSDYQKYVQRIIYIGDKLYTISPNLVKASDMETLAQVGQLVVE